VTNERLQSVGIVAIGVLEVVVFLGCCVIVYWLGQAVTA